MGRNIWQSLMGREAQDGCKNCQGPSHRLPTHSINYDFSGSTSASESNRCLLLEGSGDEGSL